MQHIPQKYHIARAEWVHDVPDMTDPRNYMMALESLAAQEPDFGCRPMYGEKPWYCDVGNNNEVHAFGATPSEAIINALAALYDAQHKGEA